jgi:hypothetical protein
MFKAVPDTVKPVGAFGGEVVLPQALQQNKMNIEQKGRQYRNSVGFLIICLRFDSFLTVRFDGSWQLLDMIVNKAFYCFVKSQYRGESISTSIDREMAARRRRRRPSSILR